MKNIMEHDKTDCTVSVCMGILLVFAAFIALFLAYYSLFYSYYSTPDYQGPVVLIRDSALRNILFFAAAVLLCAVLQRLLPKSGHHSRLAGYIWLGICCLIYCILCLIWVRALPYYPSGDQLNATAAAHYHLNGNFIMLKKTGYLGKFPYQKGLTFLYEILFRIFGHFCYGVAARIHILLGMLTMIFSYLFVEETASYEICKLLCCPLIIFCTPYLILTPYTYGDLPSICFGTVLLWSMLRFSRTLKICYAVLGCIMSCLALMTRMHTWILLIAILIGMSVASIQQKKWKPVLAGLLVMVSAFTCIKLLDYSYYLRSGYEITDGAPMILTLAMAMQDNEGGPGTYNNYQTATLSEVDYDNAAAATLARENLAENLEKMKNDPDYGVWFFKTKLMMQWTEPTFETLISTYSFDEEKEIPGWISRIYFGDLHDKLTGFSDRYQSVVYLGFLCFLPFFWRNRKENAAGWIPLITIVGGFLFSIIWEAQCRYVLPYYLWMLLYVPEGIAGAAQLLQHRHKSS